MDAALAPHLFRHEWGRLLAVLIRIFGMHNLALAEDVAQETLWRAMQLWPRSGAPDNPSAWLTATAKRLAIDELRRQRTRRHAAAELTRLLESEWTRVPVVEELFSPQPLHDDELRVMFSLAQPRLPEESRVSLILHLSCGFGEEELAAAFLTQPSAMAKRLQRAKKVVADSRSLFELTSADLPVRLESVQRALYLTFNEGFHGACAETSVRQELCREAMRLTALLSRHPQTAVPSTFALAALMHLHAARLPTRVDEEGELVPFFEQDRVSWDLRLVKEGLELLERSASGDELTAFHVEAAIAACHATASRVEDTPWSRIVALYDTLLALAPSPVVALSRAIAVGQADGAEQGLRELRAIDGVDALARYPFYEAALAELSAAAGHLDAAHVHYEAAASLARNPMERRFFVRKDQKLLDRGVRS